MGQVEGEHITATGFLTPGSLHIDPDPKLLRPWLFKPQNDDGHMLFCEAHLDYATSDSDLPVWYFPLVGEPDSEGSRRDEVYVLLQSIPCEGQTTTIKFRRLGVFHSWQIHNHPFFSDKRNVRDVTII